MFTFYVHIYVPTTWVEDDNGSMGVRLWKKIQTIKIINGKLRKENPIPNILG